MVTLQPAPRSLRGDLGGKWLFGLAVGFLVLFVNRRRGRHLPCVLALAVGVNLMWVGCGSPPVHFGQPQLQVLSIRASSGTGSSLIIHSAQAIIRTLSAHP